MSIKEVVKIIKGLRIIGVEAADIVSFILFVGSNYMSESELRKEIEARCKLVDEQQ